MGVCNYRILLDGNLNLGFQAYGGTGLGAARARLATRFETKTDGFTRLLRNGNPIKLPY